MTREIKFRGKTLDGEWVYGDLLQINGETYIHEDDYGDLDDIDFGRTFIKVDENTIGQFTGLYDKNDKEIFEGDIVQNGTYIAKVYFGEITYYYDGYYEGISCQSWCCGCDPLYGGETIIGNIYENKELLGDKYE